MEQSKANHLRSFLTEAESVPVTAFKEAIQIVEQIEGELIALKAEQPPVSVYQAMKERVDEVTLAAMKIEAERDAILELHMQTMERLLGKNANPNPKPQQ